MCALLHWVRESLVRDRAKTTNQMHAFLLEFGISMPVGLAVIKRLSTVLAENELPACFARLLMRLYAHYLYVTEPIAELETELEQELDHDETGQLKRCRSLIPLLSSPAKPLK